MMRFPPPSSKILTDARTLVRAGAGDLSVRYQSESALARLYLVGGMLQNKDTVARSLQGRMVYGGAAHFQLASASVAADSTLTFPSQASSTSSFAPSGPVPIPNGATNYLESIASAVGAGEDAIFYMVTIAPDGGSLVVTEVNA